MATPTRDDYRAQTLPLRTLIDAANIIQRALDKRFAPLGLSFRQQQLLGLLYLAKEP